MASRKWHPLLHYTLFLIRYLVDFVASIIYPFVYPSKGRLPPITEESREILTTPAVELATKIKEGSLTSRKVVETYIQRAKSVNPLINGYVETRFQVALREADEIDALIAEVPQEERKEHFREKPFLGVPFSVKECFAVKGHKQTAGLLARKDVVAMDDAPVVANIKKSGAVIIGLTNVSELCMWMESYNKIYGRTSNPYHLGKTPGGSSGGEASVIASACSVVGVGNDVGGSIRMPAFFCGIFGHKPSVGEPVLNAGSFPEPSETVNGFLATGPLTRYAKDLLPLYETLISNDGIFKNRLRLNEPVNIKDLKIFYMVDDGGSPLLSPVDGELKSAQSALLSELEKRLGLTVQKVFYDEFYWSFQIWNHKMSSGSPKQSFALDMANSKPPPVNPFKELLKWLCFKSTPHTLPAIGLAMFEKYQSPNDQNHADYLAMCDVLRQKLDNLLGSNGIFIYPSHSTPAPYHGEPLVKMFNFAHTAIFNVLGNPVTQVPLGMSKRFGVPLGIQLVGAINQDRLTLALAREIEDIFGGWVPPS